MSTDIAKTGGAPAISPLARLREPFPESEIRYLPRVWCRACRDSRAGCNQHQRQKCSKCRNNISTAHIDLRYVGHAEATNRLLNVDPEWSWEPVASDEKGLPQYDANGGLWIRLTVCGVTRLGYGHAEGKRGGDAVKEIIGDAIRNAGMRFGMALDLWTSSDLEIAEDGPKSDQSDAPERHLRRVQPGEADPWPTPSPEPRAAAQGRDYLAEARAASTVEQVRAIYKEAGADPAVSPGLADQLAEIAREKAAVQQPAAPAATADEPLDVETVDDPPAGDEHAQAVAGLRAAAAKAGVPDVDAEFQASYGLPIDQAATANVREMTALLAKAA